MDNEKNLMATIVIPVYKDAQGLQDTLRSLEHQSISCDYFEIIVCNDGALQEISEVCKKYSVTEVKISPNHGSYYARNRGIEKAKCTYIGFVDADIKVNKDWVKTGIEQLKKYDYVTGPVDIDESKAHTWTERFEVATALNMKYYFEDYHFAPTANLWVKKQLFEEQGMFDERLRSGGDSDFGNRIYKAEIYKMHYCDELSVLHPPRKYHSLVAKTKRVAIGMMDLKYIKNPNSPHKKLTTYINRVLFHPWKFALKKKCRFFERVVFYCMHRWFFTLHNYYQYQYERNKK